jgi:predicted amidohydrolase YtcJ
MLIVRAEIDGVAPRDVRLADGRISEIAPELDRRPGEPTVDAAGGALLPGLHDHHLHLFALAAAERSVRCGPPDVRDADALARALPGGLRGEWIRGIGYHESVAGELDRAALDRLVPDRPARVQHRSGALWILNSMAIDRIDLERFELPGIERDPAGRPTGRLFRLDAWLRGRLEAIDPPDLSSVSRKLAGFGVTGVTDATATNSVDALRRLVHAVEGGELLQRLLVMGGPDLPEPGHAAVERGAVKILLDENDLPRFDELEGRIKEAHGDDRPVAIHCVTRAELVLAVAAFGAAGSRSGDRLEHAAVAPPETVALVAELPLTVVTQPHFVRERGDAYRVDVDPRDRPWLYRCRGFLDASVPLAAGTDAPFGDPDPWCAMRSAVDRSTEGGAVLGAEEALSPEEALGLFTTPAELPGASPRAVRGGSPADLCLLDRPWAAARDALSSTCVAATFRAGAPIWPTEAQPSAHPSSSGTK